MSIPWEKKQTMGRMVKLGDGPDQVMQAEGIFLGSVPSPKYGADRPLLNFRDGADEMFSIPHNAALDGRLSNADVGKLVKITFAGWAITKSGHNVKQFDVFTYDGEATPEILAAFPKYGKILRDPALDTPPPALTRKRPEDDDLPF